MKFKGLLASHALTGILTLIPMLSACNSPDEQLRINFDGCESESLQIDDKALGMSHLQKCMFARGHQLTSNPSCMSSIFNRQRENIDCYVPISAWQSLRNVVVPK